MQSHATIYRAGQHNSIVLSRPAVWGILSERSQTLGRRLFTLLPRLWLKHYNEQRTVGLNVCPMGILCGEFGLNKRVKLNASSFTDCVGCCCCWLQD